MTTQSVNSNTSEGEMRNTISHVKGSLVALVTPMTPKGEILWDDLAQLIEWHISSGTNGVVIAGTTGECATFSIEEQSQLFHTTKKMIADRVPLVAGTGANCTAEAIELTHAARDAGADATLTVVPYYNKPSQEGMYQHFLAQADAVNIPQILYNVPSRCGSDLSNETVIRLAAHQNIQGLKDATGDLQRAYHLITDLKAAGLDDFMLYSGEDMSSMPFIHLGGHGCISVTANLKPEEMATMCKLALNQSWGEAARVDTGLRFWHKNLFIESSPAPTKYALCKLGKITHPSLRLPLVTLSEPCARVIDTQL